MTEAMPFLQKAILLSYDPLPLPGDPLLMTGVAFLELGNFAETFVQLGRGFLPLGAKPLRGAFFPAILFL